MQMAAESLPNEHPSLGVRQTIDSTLAKRRGRKRRNMVSSSQQLGDRHTEDRQRIRGSYVRYFMGAA